METLSQGRGGLWEMGSTGLRLEREGGSGEHGLEHEEPGCEGLGHEELEHEELGREELGLELGHKELGLKHDNLKDLADDELEHKAHEDYYSVIWTWRLIGGHLVATWGLSETLP